MNQTAPKKRVIKTTAKSVEMRMAKATESDMEGLWDLANLLNNYRDGWLDEVVVHGSHYCPGDEDFEEMLLFKLNQLSAGLFRVVHGYEILLENFCDPSKDYLALKEELVKLVQLGERSSSRMMTDLRSMNRC